ncbi:hypothetical protein [Methylibium sp.]|uniref:hypothetical protein n=1 Tax=Methylibium sp. TaxID=2067992 RepID=UPI0018142AC3|nr:hypothetical protein [Methylibium sp.]MBA3590816.1 hypothetical protein [Methylibium sp.]
MNVQPLSAQDSAAYRILFDNSDNDADLRDAWKAVNRALASLAVSELTRLQREYDAARSIDFFPSDASVEAEATWTDFNRRIEAVLSPDEPQGPELILQRDLDRARDPQQATRQLRFGRSITPPMWRRNDSPRESWRSVTYRIGGGAAFQTAAESTASSAAATWSA